MPRQNLGRVKGDKGDPFTFDDFTSGQLDRITPKMVLGNVTTLGPDENAAVYMRNEGLKNYVDFAIPRGKNGAEAKNIPAENVEMADKTTLESTMATVNESVNTNNTEINKIKTPTFTDTVGTYTTLNAANTAAETASNAIKSKVNILTTLSNMKKSFSAIVQGLKILATNVGMIQGITSDLNSESDYIAASSKALATLNGNLQHKASLNSENTFTKTITSTNDKDLSSTSFMDGQFSSWAPFHLNPNARAGYGFHNQGNNACFLYLDLDGTLKCIDAGGGIRQIQTTRIN